MHVKHVKCIFGQQIEYPHMRTKHLESEMQANSMRRLDDNPTQSNFQTICRLFKNNDRKNKVALANESQYSTSVLELSPKCGSFKLSFVRSRASPPRFHLRVERLTLRSTCSLRPPHIVALRN